MRLQFIRYQSRGKYEYGLFLVVVDTGSELQALKSKDMDIREIDIIRQNISALQDIPPQEVFSWLKRYTPRSYTKAFRRLQKSATTLIKDYGQPIKL